MNKTRTFLLALCALFFVFGALTPDDAYARRMGGGGSFGMKRSIRPPAAAPKAPPKAAPAAGNAAGAPGRSSWLGPIAGIAAGLGLAALMSHLGLSEEFGSLVLLALLAWAAFVLLRRFGARTPTGAQPAWAGAQAQSAQPLAFEAQTAPAANSALAGFDAQGFARNAKLQFIRLQAAHDAGNLADIQAVTTPEVFAEIKMQVMERANAPQQTDVVELHAEVLDVAEEAGQYVVSVRFHGLLREEADAAPAPFNEAWHLVKPVQGNEGWRIAGIEQV